MRPLPNISMAKLREIGRRKWDALPDRECGNADQGDRYLATAAVRIWNGDADETVADYIVEVEIDRLGLDTGQGIRERALDLVGELRSYLGSVR